MALTWDTAGVRDYENVCWLSAEADDPNHGIEKGDRILNPVTNALIWQSLSTGIGTITEENAGEVFARISIVEKVYGASLWNSEGPRPITMDDVLQHVGLTTNASFKDESRASFTKRHLTYFLDEEKHRFSRHAEKVAPAS